jgi:hypothetical protein
MSKPRRIIIEHYGMYDYLILFPSGRIEHARNKSQAENLAKRYFGRAKKTAIDFIEWRDCLDKGAALKWRLL